MKRGGPESFTSGASAVLDAAQDEARALGYGYVSTEHLLLALLDGDNTALRVLVKLGCDPAAIRDLLRS